MPKAGHMPVMNICFSFYRGIALNVDGKIQKKFKNSTSHLYLYTCKEQLCERFAAGIKFTNKQTNKQVRRSLSALSLPTFTAPHTESFTTKRTFYFSEKHFQIQL